MTTSAKVMTKLLGHDVVQKQKWQIQN